MEEGPWAPGGSLKKWSLSKDGESYNVGPKTGQMTKRLIPTMDEQLITSKGRRKVQMGVQKTGQMGEAR
jgi:hypothetical protein